MFAMRGHVFNTAMRVRMFSSQRISDLFSPNTAEFVAAAGSVSSIPSLTRLPEVVVTGRANVGKSTLLNAVVKRRRLVASSKKPGRTKTLTFFRVGPHPGKVVLVDAPGYGQRGRPEWGQLFDQYLKTRRELCRVYILLNAKHGLSEADKLMLQDLDQRIQSGDAKWTLQAIVTKADLVSPDKLDAAIKGIKQAIFENAPTDMRRSIVEACGLARSVSCL